MASQMMKALAELSQERHIDELYLLDKLEESLAKSYADILNLDNGARVTIDRDNGHIYIYELVPKGEQNEDGTFDEYEEVPVKDVAPEEASRVAALQAKAAIAQIVKDAAKEEIYEEFSDRVGDVITGNVLQSTPNFTILKIREGVEAELPHFDAKRFPKERNERPQGERYGHNQRVKALIIDVKDPHAEQTNKSDQNRASIVVSRTHPDLLRRLFEIEVPEIYDGVVEICSVAREPGKRSKIAVESLEPRLDPVGACVGPRGSRVRNVVSELRGERVDIVQYSEDPVEFVSNALSPANVDRVIVDVENNYATVIVPDDQLSLAIGKEGQNARLAARLTGYHIDIKNASMARDILARLQKSEGDSEELLENAEDTRCAYVDANGTRCRNQARQGSRFCGIHGGQDDVVATAEADVAVSDDVDSLI